LKVVALLKCALCAVGVFCVRYVQAVPPQLESGATGRTVLSMTRSFVVALLTSVTLNGEDWTQWPWTDCRELRRNRSVCYAGVFMGPRCHDRL